MALPTLKSTTQRSSSLDLKDPQVQAAVLQQLGIEQPKPKANILQRLTSALSAFESGNAVFKAIETGDPLQGLGQYASDIAKGLSGVITGDIDNNKKTFSDVLERLGVANRLVKNVGGFALDVALDPTTYVTLGAGAGKKVGGKTLTKSGEVLLDEGIEKGTRSLIRKVGTESIEQASEATIRKAMGEFAEEAAKQGIKLNILNKGPREIIREFAEQRVLKFADKTGAKLTQELTEGAAKAGLKAADDVFAKEAFRFAGKPLFTLQEGLQSVGLKSYFDPISTATSAIASTPIGKSISQTAKNAIYPIKRMFSRSAELAGTKSIEKQYKSLIEEVIRTQDVTRFAGAQTDRAAREFYNKLISATENPEVFPYLFENTPKELIDQLPAELQNKILPLMGQIKQAAQEGLAGQSVAGKAVARSIADAPASNIMLEQASQFLDKVTPDNKKALIDIFKNIPEDETADSVRKVLGGYLTDFFDVSQDELSKLTKQSLEITPADKIIKYQTDLFRLADKFQDPISKAESNLMSSPDNIGGLVDLITQQRLRADETTALLRNAGVITEDAGIDKNMSYLMRQTVQDGQDIAEDLYKVGTGLKKNLKRRTKEFLAQGELEGIQYTTTGKMGKDAAKALADNIGRTQSLVAKASAWKDLEDKAFDMVDELGNKIVLSAEEVGTEAIKSGLYKQIKSPLTGKALFNGGYLPKDAADIMQKTYDNFFADKNMNTLVKMFDKVQSLWKQSVTAWFPSFHVRNGASNIFTNTMAGVTNPNVYKYGKELQDYSNLIFKEGLDSKAVEEAGKKIVGNTGYSFKELLNIAERNGVISGGTFWEELEGKGTNIAASAFDKFRKLPTNFGNAIEDNAKIAHFIDQLSKGNSIQDSVASVKKYLFDYGDLTDIEKNVFRRFIPFYTWARKNAELQLSTIASQPGKYSTILKGFRDIQDAFTDLNDEDIAKLPSWARNGVQVIKGGDGAAQVIQGFGTPIEAFSGFVGSFIPGTTDEPDILNSLSPLMKIPLEKAFGKTLFTGRELDKDISASQFKDLVTNLPEPIKNLIGYQEIERETKSGETYIEYIMNPDAKFWLNALIGRFVTTANKSAKLAKERDFVTGLDLTTGLKSYDFNLLEEEEKRRREQEQALYDELYKLGLAKEYTIPSLTPQAKEMFSQ